VRESIIRRVERHGGVAQVHSAPGEGCEVTLRVGRK
jgi:signal transduction histidine kinase